VNERLRAGFTLVELIVAITILLVLATIAVLFVPRTQEQEKAASGARQLFGWLQMAKTRAMTDRAPRGVRLLPYTGDASGMQVRELQFIEQPANYIVQPGVATQTGKPPSATNPPLPFRRIQVNAGALTTAVLEPPQFPVNPLPDFSGGFSIPPYTLQDWPVQKDDYLEIGGGGLLRRILSVSNNTLTLGNPPFTQAVPATLNYKIIRSPRVSGEDALQLPVDVAIDLVPVSSSMSTADKAYNLPPLNPWFDILFSPSGAVVGPGAAYDKIILWVRDMTQAQATDNEPRLVCIYTRTGTIATHAVDPGGSSGGSYYTFTTDGRPSGQ
jgi:prepilin-type N-terminal cleavage/methylation domain-containing protein